MIHEPERRAYMPRGSFSTGDVFGRNLPECQCAECRIALAIDTTYPGMNDKLHVALRSNFALREKAKDIVARTPWYHVKRELRDALRWWM